jgi:transcriptional regulator with XRE-family HTH domain
MHARPCGGRGYYACEPKKTDGCGKISIDAPAVEAHVAVQLFMHLEKLDAAGMLSSDEHADRRGTLVNELQALDGRRAELSQRWAGRKLTIEQFDIMNASVDADQARAEAELSGLPAPIENISPAELREAWPEMTLDEKRKVVDDWIENIVVHPPSAVPATTKTVAERAGLSQHTIIRIFNDSRAYPAETIRRVMAAAEEVGYEYPAGRWPRRATADLGRAEIFWRHD